jgi:hypothetical protein
MGAHPAISYDDFPKQGPHLGKRVKVCFHYDTSRLLPGRVVRDDAEDPWITLIELADGRVVLATECQYSVPPQDADSPLAR